MAIKEVMINGTRCYEVKVHMRSQMVQNLRTQRKRTGIKSLREAQRLEKLLTKEVSIELARLEGSGLPWGELMEKYYEVHKEGGIGIKKVQLSTIWDNIGTLRRFTASWNKLTCDQISPADVRKVLEAMLEQGYSRSRLRAVRSCINTIYKWGIEYEAIRGVRFSPAQDIHLGKYHEDKPPQILTHSEIQRLLDEARDMEHEWYPVWFMALHTGMRSGELYALEWKDIDLEHKLITCSKSYNGRMKLIKSTKAGYWRKVPISAEVDAMLTELRAKAEPDDVYVLPRINKWRRGEAAKVLREFCTDLGINSINFHALRACFATHLLNAGVSTPVVKKICGWTEEKVMTKYIRLAGIDVQGATERLKFMSPVKVQPKVANMTDFRRRKKFVPDRD